MVARDGAVLVAEELLEETMEENSNSFLRHLYYNFSILHCLPQAVVYPESAATGAVMSASKLEDYANKAGFSRLEYFQLIILFGDFIVYRHEDRGVWST